DYYCMIWHNGWLF
nr:immunoglobulin light chain junction region [Macaca mulatta]